MSIVIPPELNWLVKITAGEDWPKGDEDGLRELAQIWTDTSSQVAQVVGELDAHTRGVLASMHGQPAEQFQKFVSDLRSNLPQLARTSAETGKMAFDQAAEVEYAKWMIISQMIITAAEIAYAIAMAPWTFGASMAWIPAAKAIATAVVRQILTRLLQHVAIEVISQVALDAAIQGIQMLKGDRTTWNTQATAGAALSGAISGLAGAGIGMAGGKAFGRNAGDLVPRTITNTAAGAGAGAASTGVNNVVFGDDSSVGWGAASGAFGGAVGGHGRGHGNGSTVHGPGEMNLHAIDAPDVGAFGGGGPRSPGGSGSDFPTTGAAGPADTGGAGSGGGPRGLDGLDSPPPGRTSTTDAGQTGASYPPPTQGTATASLPPASDTPSGSGARQEPVPSAVNGGEQVEPASAEPRQLDSVAPEQSAGSGQPTVADGGQQTGPGPVEQAGGEPVQGAEPGDLPTRDQNSQVSPVAHQEQPTPRPEAVGSQGAAVPGGSVPQSSAPAGSPAGRPSPETAPTPRPVVAPPPTARTGTGMTAQPAALPPRPAATPGPPPTEHPTAAAPDPTGNAHTPAPAPPPVYADPAGNAHAAAPAHADPAAAQGAHTPAPAPVHPVPTPTPTTDGAVGPRDGARTHTDAEVSTQTGRVRQATVTPTGSVFTHPGDSAHHAATPTDVRYVAVVPLKTGATPQDTAQSVQDLVHQYEQAARAGAGADPRGVSLVVGLNRSVDDLPAGQTIDQHIGAHQAALGGLSSSIPVTVVGAGWQSPSTARHDVPFGAIRQQLVSSPEVTDLAGNSGATTTYLHFGDGDVRSMVGDDGQGLLQNAAPRLSGPDAPKIVSGGYRLTDPDGTAVSRASEQDAAVRRVFARTDPALNYFPEPNTFYRFDGGDGRGALDPGHDFGVFDQEGGKLVDSAVSHDYGGGRPVTAWHGDLSITTDGGRVNAGGAVDPQSHATANTWGNRVGPWMESRGAPIDGERLNRLARYATDQPGATADGVRQDLVDLRARYGRDTIRPLETLLGDSRAAVRAPDAVGPDGTVDRSRVARQPAPAPPSTTPVEGPPATRGSGATGTDPSSGTPGAPRGDHVVGSSAFDHRRDGARVSTVHTESFRVLRGEDGGLEHVGPYLRSEVVTTHYEARRIQAEDGSWVHDATIPVHLAGDPRVVADVLGRAQDALAQVNHRYRLPNGDQLHVRLENRPAGDGVPTVRVQEGAGRSDQGTWFSHAPDSVLAHESLHALGLPDGYRTRSVLGGQVDTVGVMGAAANDGGRVHLTGANLQRIQDVAAATAPLHDHGLDATPTAPVRSRPDDRSGAGPEHVPASAPPVGPPSAGTLHPAAGHDHTAGTGDTASVRGADRVFRHAGDGTAPGGVRFVATVPLHADGTPAQTHAAVQQLIRSYEAAARTGGQADVTLVVGLNHRAGSGTAITAHLDHLGQQGLRSSIPVRVVGAEWTSRRRNGLDVPYGAIRQQLATHPEVTAALDERGGRGDGAPPRYLHLGDADVGSMTSRDASGTEHGLFVRAAPTLRDDTPRMASGPYRLTTSDAARAQSERDAAVRRAMADADPRLVYPPEPNTFYRVDTAEGDPALDHDHDLGVFDQEGRRLADAVRHDPDARRWYDDLSLETSGDRVNAQGREDVQSHANAGVWADRTVDWADSVHGVALAGQHVRPIAQWATGGLPDGRRTEFTDALRTVHTTFRSQGFSPSAANAAVRTIRTAAEGSRAAVHPPAPHTPAPAPSPVVTPAPRGTAPDGRRVTSVDDLAPVHDALGGADRLGDHRQLDDVLAHRPETLRGSGRRVTVELDGRPVEVRVSLEPGDAPVPEGGLDRREHVAGGGDRTRGETSTGDQPPELRGSVTAGAVIGPTGTVGGTVSLAHPTAAKAEASTTLRDTRTAVLDTSAPRPAPVQVTVEVAGAAPRTVGTTGHVGTTGPAGPAPARPGGPLRGSTELAVPEGPVRLGRTGDGRDVFTAVAGSLHPDVTKPGAPGRGALDTFLSSAGVADRMPDLLGGHWVDSPDLVAAGGHRIGSVRMRLTDADLTPVDTRRGGLEPEVRGTTDLPTTAATRSGGDASVGIGGGTTVPPVGGTAQVTASGGAHTGAEVKGSTPVSVRRRVDFSGTTEGHRLRGTLEIETPDGTAHRVPVEQTVRMSPWQADRALGQQPPAGAATRRPPEYLAQGRSIGSGRVLGVGGEVDLAAHVGRRFRDLGLEGLAPQRDAFATGRRPWSGRRDVPGASDPSGSVAADRDLRQAFGPDRLAHEMDAMLGDGYRATFAERGWFRTRRVEVRVTARLTDLTDAGPVDGTALTSTRTGEDRHGVTRSADHAIGVGVEGRVNVPHYLDGQRVMPAPTAGVRYTHGTARTAAGGPEAGRLTQVGGRPAHAFDGRVTYDVEITSHTRVRRWVRRTTPGLPGREDPTWWPARRRTDGSHAGGEAVTVLTPVAATRAADAVDPPPVHSLPGRTPPGRLRTAEEVAVGGRPGAGPPPRLIEIEAFTGTDVLARAARDALVDAAGGDTAILGHGTADATRIGSAFGPQRLTEPGVLHRGASLPGLRYGRRAADRVGELGLHLELRNPALVSAPTTLSVRENVLGAGRAAGTTRRSDGVEVSAGLVVGVNGTQPTGGATPSSGPGPVAANSARVSHGRTRTTTEGSAVTGTTERGTNTPAQEAVLVRFDAAAEVVAESRNRGVVHDAVRPTAVGRAGREVLLPGAVHAWVSREEAVRLGVLPGVAPVPPAHGPVGLAPPPGLAGGDLRLGAGTVTSAHDLRGLVGDLRTQLDGAGHRDLLPTSMLDDGLHTLHRAVALTGHHSVVGLLERASREGAAIDVPRARTFGRDDDRLVLRARPAGPAAVDDVVHDGTGTFHKTTGAVSTNAGSGREAATGVGAAVAAQHRWGGSGPNYTGQAGAGAGASVTAAQGTRTAEVDTTKDVTQAAHAGPMAVVRRPVEFTLEYRRGGRTLATTPPRRQDLEVRVPVDDLAAEGTGVRPTAGPVDPVGQRLGGADAESVAAWRTADGAAEVPPRAAVLDTPDGADRLVDATLRDAGGSSLLTPDAPARAPLAQVTSPEVRAATLRRLLREGLPVPGQVGGRTVGGQDAEVTLHGRLRGARWGAPADGGTLEGSASRIGGSEVTATSRTSGAVDLRPLEGGGGTFRPDAAAQVTGEVRLPAESSDPRPTTSLPGHDGRRKAGERTWTVVADLDLLAVASVRDRIGLPGRASTTAARITTMPGAVTLRMTESEAAALIGSAPPREVADAQRTQSERADDWRDALADRDAAVRARDLRPAPEVETGQVERLRDEVDHAEHEALVGRGDHAAVAELRDRLARAEATLRAEAAAEEQLAARVSAADRAVVRAREAWWEAKRARDAALRAFHDAPEPDAVPEADAVPVPDGPPVLPMPDFGVVDWPGDLRDGADGADGADEVPEPAPAVAAGPPRLPEPDVGGPFDMDAILNPR